MFKIIVALGLAPALACALAPSPTAARGGGEDPAEFEKLSVILEVNQTDGDAEIVTAVKTSEGMETLAIRFPDGKKKVIELKTKDAVGQGEVLLESAEPSIDEVLEAFPEGTYSFEVKTVSGQKICGEATLSHHVLEGPEFWPCDGCEVSPEDLEISWIPVAGAAGYIIELENDDLDVNVTARLGAETVTFRVPDGFLQPGTEYDLGVAAISQVGNITFAEGSFTTTE